MRMLVPLLAGFLAFTLAALPLPGAAEPFAIRLGIEKIVLNAPPGFTDTIDLASPRLQDLSATLTSASNRVLLFGVTDADFRKFSTGDQLDLTRYVIAVTPKGLERERVSSEQFAALVSDSLQGLGKPAGTVEDLTKFLEKQPVGRANLLEELKREPAQVSVLQATRLPSLPGAKFWNSSTPQYLVFTTTLLLVRGKALQVSIYSLYDRPADVEWLRATTLRWTDELVRLNPR